MKKLFNMAKVLPLIWVITSDIFKFKEKIVNYHESIVNNKEDTEFEIYFYDIDLGGPRDISNIDNPSETEFKDMLETFLQTESFGDNVSVLFVEFPEFLFQSEDRNLIIQSIINNILALNNNNKSIVFISNTSEIPEELKRYVHLYEDKLPDKDRLYSILEKIENITQNTITNKDVIINNALGLTEYEFITSIRYGIGNELDLVDAILEKKNENIKKSGLLKFYNPEPEDTFDNIGGLDILKDFLSKSVKSELSRGVMLLGVPGTGKSAISKALANESDLPMLQMDFGSIFDSYVGSSEARIRNALELVESVSPCILFIDEIEKGLSGINSSHQTDGGTGARVFGTFLQWMNDRKKFVYVIATCNDISKLPSEFLRAERWDAIFFIDIPSEEEAIAIWKLYMKKYEIDEDIPNTSNWTGAEIKTACRLSKVLNCSLKESMKYVVPVYKSAGEQIELLRKWACDRCVPASTKKPSVTVNTNKDKNIDKNRIFI